MHQHVLAVLPDAKQCAVIGDVTRRLVVTPDIEGMLQLMSTDAPTENPL
jgi:hypothetical protein